jgi:hypothetical protein
MKIEQSRWRAGRGWSSPPARDGHFAQVAFVFGGGAAMTDAGPLEDVRRAFPEAILFGCSAAGAIEGTSVADDTLLVTALTMESSSARLAVATIARPSESRAAGASLGAALPAEGLVHVIALADGLRVNGSALAEGLADALPAGVGISGGLAADDDRFRHTLVVAGRDAAERRVAALGFYGPRLTVRCGTGGGWDPFGPERRISRAEGNTLYELDGKSALALYRRYLGEDAGGLPAAGLRFPLSVRPRGGDGVVRSLLAIDESHDGLVFAGDMPVGHHARLMKANVDRLVDGAQAAADAAAGPPGGKAPQLALLVSCVGRKLVLRGRVEEEIEAVRDALGTSPALAGYYSYGEMAPARSGGRCELHNQTMTVTTFLEV